MFSAFRTFGRMGAPAGRTLAQQIAAMSPSLWLEPSVTSGYQDSAGTTALTQPGGGSADPPVGKAMDLSGNGNHAIQATSTARPKLSARVNLLTYTEDFTNSEWTDSGGGVTKSNAVYTAPDGTLTGGSFTALGSNSSVNQAFTSTAARHTETFYVRAGTASALRFGINDGGWLAGSATVVSGSGSITGSDLFTMTGLDANWTKVQVITTLAIPASAPRIYFYPGPASQSNGDSIGIWHPQLELGSTATAYQAVTDANNYATTGWPLIHQFDGVDDAYTSTFASSLGSDCTIVTANVGAAPTIQTAQTIGTTLTINATHAGKLVFNRALTAAETAIVTAWATQKGALP